MLAFNSKEVIDVIKILRDNNNSNNTQLSLGLIDYFKYGIKPTKESSTKLFKLNDDIQKQTSIDELNNILRKESSFGIVNLRKSTHPLINDYIIVYFSNLCNVWYIDCQLYDGIKQEDNGCIFTNLSNKYKFDNDIYYIPMKDIEISQLSVNNKLYYESLSSEFSNDDSSLGEIIDNYLNNINLHDEIICANSDNSSFPEIVNLSEEIFTVSATKKPTSEFIHTKVKNDCKKCNKNTACIHNKRRRYCKKSNSSRICQHDKNKRICVECKGIDICLHDKIKWNCKECNKCLHNKNRRYCVECNKDRLCLHNKVTSNCNKCKTCKHKTLKYECLECNKNKLCIHSKIKRNCLECNKPEEKVINRNKTQYICQHNKQDVDCEDCNNKQPKENIIYDRRRFCFHNILKHNCAQCNRENLCTHNVLRFNCQECNKKRKQIFSVSIQNKCDHNLPQHLCIYCKNTFNNLLYKENNDIYEHYLPQYSYESVKRYKSNY